MSRRLSVWLIVLLPITLTACSTSALYQARSQFYSGDSSAALTTLADSGVVSSSDRLLYLLEKGLILHESGDFEGSVRELLAAVDYLDKYDYVSLGDEGKTLLANDWAKRYTGEYSERLWVHSYLMMNFLALGKYDSAAVEARRALERIDMHGGALEKDHFTRSLIGLSFEAAGQLNDAYIEYRKLAKQLPDGSSLDGMLYRFASRLGFESDAREYKNQLRAAGQFVALQSDGTEYEAIVFVSNGFIPRKYSDSLLTDYDVRLSFPRYYFAPSTPPAVDALINGESCKCVSVTSDLGHLVSASLAQRAAKLTAKAVARVVVKNAVAEAVEDKDEIAGGLVRLLFYALEEADTRSWQSLPRHLSMVRVPIASNDTKVTIAMKGSGEVQVMPLIGDSKKEGRSQSPRLLFYRLRQSGKL